MNHSISVEEIGKRIRAFRLGAGYTPEELADKAGISRAAIYRYESGQAPKVDTLVILADLLNVSLPTLLGAGVEYIASALSFFERMRQLEESVDQITVLFGPISYLLTTEIYDEYLPSVLKESIPSDIDCYEQALNEIDSLIKILRQRKLNYIRRQPNIIGLISAAELTQFLRLGLIGAHRPNNVDLNKRQEIARTEIENIVRLLCEQPIGVQLGVVVDSMPGATLQIFKHADKKTVAVSPYRLGTFANTRVGVATISSAPDATELYQEVTNELWTRSLKGSEAAAYIQKKIL